MKYILKRREVAIPNGMVAIEPATGFKSSPWTAFEAQCQGWQQARAGNPGACKRFRKSTDMDAIRQEVDEQLGQMLHDRGFHDYVNTILREGGGAEAAVRPFIHRNPAERIAQVVKAAAVSVEWITSGAEAVPIEQATKRGAVCVKCPLNNNHADWLSLFTKPAAEAIKKALEARGQMQLKTPCDDELGVCDACDCVTKLKIHMPIDKILSMMPQNIFDGLDASCWIRAEK